MINHHVVSDKMQAELDLRSTDYSIGYLNHSLRNKFAMLLKISDIRYLHNESMLSSNLMLDVGEDLDELDKLEAKRAQIVKDTGIK